MLRRRPAATATLPPPAEAPAQETPPPYVPVLSKQERRAVTAAVAKISMEGAAWRAWRFGDMAWQMDGWRLYDITGQLRFVANWAGNSISRCRLYVAEVDDSGEAGAEVKDEKIANLAAGPLGKGPAKAEAMRLLGINLYVPGEAYIIAEAEGGDDGEDRWFVVSGGQIKRQGDKIQIRRSSLYGGGVLEFRDGVDLMLRVWTPHPRDVDQPDSPTRSAIPDLREIEAIRKREFAELDSRLTGAGLLPLPEGADFPRGDDDPTGVQGFAALLMRAMATSLQDRASAEAMVPIMFTVPGEYLDKIKPVQFWSELSNQLLPLREAAVRSLAQALDVPPEILLGMGDVNHWSGWLVSEDAITTQIKPLLSRIADALTQGYLRSALEAIGEDPDRYVYAFDTAPLTTRPNRTADALNFHDAMLLSDAATRAAANWGDEDAPSQEEKLRRLAEKAVLTAPTLLADPTIRELIGLGKAPAPAPAPTDTETPGESPALPPAPAPQSDPNSPPEQTPQSEEDSQPAQAAITAVSNLLVTRALGMAGTRLIPHRQRDRYAGTPRHELHTCHGMISRTRAEEVLGGAWAELPMAAADLHVDPTQLQALLHGFCVELLVRGIPYDPMLLRELIRAAGARAHLVSARRRR